MLIDDKYYKVENYNKLSILTNNFHLLIYYLFSYENCMHTLNRKNNF